MLRDGIADYVTQTFILLRCGCEGIVGRGGELVIVPELSTYALELLPAEILEAHDVVFVAKLVHLCVEEELLSVSSHWSLWHVGIRNADTAGEILTTAVIVALVATNVMWANITGNACYDGCAGVREAIVIAVVASSSVYNHTRLAHALAVREFWIVFPFVEVLHKELDQGRLVVVEGNFVDVHLAIPVSRSLYYFNVGV